MVRNVNRRDVLRGAVASATLLGLSASSYSRVLGANSRLRVASVGTGGKGRSDLQEIAKSPKVDVAALCDVDSSKSHLGWAAEAYPNAKTYADWRVLLDSDHKSFDGIIVSTPDFMHAPVAIPALLLGKHVYCEKPLSHTVFESRQMQLAAKKHGAVTQMGNQIQSHSYYRTAVEWVHSGVVGKIKEVHSWQGGNPTWRAAAAAGPGTGSDPIPAEVNWDLWQGVAPERGYKAQIYHPFNWRAWQHYGTGQLGDFACHILDPVFKALKISSPISLKVSSPELPEELWTDRCTVHYLFPGTEHTTGKTINVTWYDAAGIKPEKEQFTDLPAVTDLPGAGSVLVGEKGTLVIPHVGQPRFYPNDKATDLEPAIVEGVDHYVQWAEACLGNGSTTSHFDYSAPLSEAVLLGTVGIRFPEQELQWDSEKLQITNVPDANAFLSKEYRKGWELPTVS